MDLLNRLKEYEEVPEKTTFISGNDVSRRGLPTETKEREVKEEPSQSEAELQRTLLVKLETKFHDSEDAIKVKYVPLT